MNVITRKALENVDNEHIMTVVDDILRTLSCQLQGKNYRVSNFEDRVDELNKLKDLIKEDYKMYEK